jgi:hypothetical protein
VAPTSTYLLPVDDESSDTDWSDIEIGSGVSDRLIDEFRSLHNFWDSYTCICKGENGEVTFHGGSELEDSSD